ncbi:hypothetical protein B1757_09190 [Acidithiobacillus marinus]|uniref:Uncharacterized protein n=1 Tax=Acidithiobacillus marinus TaxID=187490 RepID=A0A2I1DLI1_9PROT|nr:hypothetical protein B1757_09190 [Acidithiobacillus marinus]
MLRKTRHTTDVEALIRVMVLNRLCNPESKLGGLRWVETVSGVCPGRTGATVPGIYRSAGVFHPRWPRRGSGCPPCKKIDASQQLTLL